MMIASCGLLLAYVAGSFGFAVWIGSVFNAALATIVFVILSVPAVVAVRMLLAKRSSKKRELAYLCITFATVLIGTGFLVRDWFDRRLDVHLAEVRHFEMARDELFGRIRKQPRFSNVTLDYTMRKGGRVYIKGSVVSQADLDDLKQMADELELSYHLGTEVESKHSPKSEPSQ